MKNLVFISLGSNLGKRQAFLHQALQRLSLKPNSLIAQSLIYQTQPWGVPNQPPFLNQVILLQTPLSPSLLLNHILSIEQDLGRTRIQKWEARKIDIDILFYNDLILNTPTLTIPHPLLHQRNFILIPLANMGFQNLIHPVLKKNIHQLIQSSPDKNLVMPLSSQPL